ncbi:MAG: hypothetical protein JXR25_08810 [Pontiellaceae bacterium]|nr:hypothetical protein [Pontiellaceae bacterium]MBN2784915.1 hypothetical protein [Pontiellaceae bacterium]
MKVKHWMAAALFACVCGASATPIMVSVTGTADSTALGYTLGESYTFNWTVSDTYSGSVNDFFGSAYNSWFVDTTSDPWLWADLSGDGLSGTYSRPSGNSWAPSDQLYVDSDMFVFYAGNEDSSSTMGLTVNGVEVGYFYCDINIPDVDYSDTEFVKPATWLATYAGTYAQSGSYIELYAVNDDTVTFTPTSVTVQAVPEPAVIALISLFGVGFIAVRRIFMV